MEIQIQLADQPIAANQPPPVEAGTVGARTEFYGIVRGEEHGQPIRALEYEAYAEMVQRQVRRLLEELAAEYACLSARVVHRVGLVPVGAVAMYVGIASVHRAEGLGLLAAFLDRLKQDVPIWKRPVFDDLGLTNGVPCRTSCQPLPPATAEAFTTSTQPPAVARSLDEALADIRMRVRPLPPERVALVNALGRMLREPVGAPEDLPPFDRAAVDGYAILRDDTASGFRVVDHLRAGDWRPRLLQPGEAVRIATGAALPGPGLRVVMQEATQLEGEAVRLLRRGSEVLNVRFRGEDRRAGELLAPAGRRLNAGTLALLAGIGHVQPLVSPRLRVLHLTTGDEVIPPHQPPKPGQIRDSNSILVRSLLSGWPCAVEQQHLPEDLEAAWHRLDPGRVAETDVLLVSGGASVGAHDFTRVLLERLGFEIVFDRIRIRPGRPTIFGVNGRRVAFGLPGNPLAHYVVFHLGVATALACLLGSTETPPSQRGRLAADLRSDACPRETLWPARLEWPGAAPRLRPLVWRSSGDLTCLGEVSALIRVPPQTNDLAAETEVEFFTCFPLTSSMS